MSSSSAWLPVVAIIGLLSPELVALIGAGRYAPAVPAVGLALIGMLGTACSR